MKLARIMILLATMAAAVLAATAPARASLLETDIEDERLLLSGSIEGPFAAAHWNQLGIKYVRIQAHWWQIAPEEHGRHKPQGFDSADPNSPGYNWWAVDHAISVVVNAGMKPMLTITGPGPVWASSSPRKHNIYWKPRPKEFARFASAAAQRYGAFVDRYLIYNEPNQKGWLQPQWKCRKRRHHRRHCSPVSPNVYRNLVRAAVPAVHRADPGSEAVIGELAPVGNRPISNNTPMAPLPFLRQMGCVNRHYHHKHGGACKHFRAAFGDSFGYHPHPKKLAPDRHNKDRNDAQFGDFKRLFRALDKLSVHHRIRAPGHRFRIRLTEFGYETNPPDRANGVSQSRQNRYLQQAAYIAWKTGRIESINFYGWEDEPTHNLGRGRNHYGNYQTGLKEVDGKDKPALSTFAAPFVIDYPKHRKTGRFWGQVRPDSTGKVTVQIRHRHSKTWRTLRTVSTRSDGTWSKRLRVSKSSSYRYSWTPASTLASPFPEPQYSGVVNMRSARRQHSPLKAASPK